MLAELSQIHNTFHVSQLRKCEADETSVAILDKKVMVFRNKEVPLVQVQLQHRKGSESTWEPESEIRE